MRIALQATSAVGVRTGRILMAEAELEALGLVGRHPGPQADPRLQAVDDLTGWDLLVSESASGLPAARHAGVPAVCADDERQAMAAGAPFAEAGVPLLAGCNLRSGLGPALASHPSVRTEEALETVVGWTTPGKPVRRGEALPFPDPVGPLWARPPPPLPWSSSRPDLRFLAAPSAGPWAGVSARVATVAEEGVVVRTFGVSDDRDHLEAVALAAGALTALRGSLEPGLGWPIDHGTLFLEQALRVGLGVAVLAERQAAPRRR